MEFHTKLVVKRMNKKAWPAFAGLFITASSLILVFIPSLTYYIPYVFGTGISIVVIGAIIARGDVSRYGLSEEDLVINRTGIGVGAKSYAMNQVRNMDFDVQAYAGMYVNDGAMISGSNSDGMTNSLQFEVDGTKVSCGFFLENPQHVQRLGVLFNEFYERHIPFVERNKSTRTYMFQQLSERELVDFKRKYGYA